MLVYELGVIFQGHLAPLPKQFATSPQVTYISAWRCFKILQKVSMSFYIEFKYDGQGVPLEYFSMILRGPYKDIFIPLKFVWGGLHCFRNLVALQKLAGRLCCMNEQSDMPKFTR